MMRELTYTTTLLFRRAGSAPKDRKKLVMLASMELHWFSPALAERFLDRWENQ